jgi:hypothetical protein
MRCWVTVHYADLRLGQTREQLSQAEPDLPQRVKTQGRNEEKKIRGNPLNETAATEIAECCR